MVDLAIKTLLHDKLRFAITVAGVAFAVALIVFQLGLFLGLLENASTEIDHANADLWVTSKNCANIDFGLTFPETRVDRLRSIVGVARADNLLLAYVIVSLPNGSLETAETYGLKDFHAWNLPWDVAEGNVDDLRRGAYAFFDESSRKRFGNFAVGDYREVDGHRLRIIGVTRGVKSFTTTPVLFMDYDVLQSLNLPLREGKTSFVLVKLEPGANVDAVRNAIRERLPYAGVYTKQEWAARSRAYWITNTGLGLNMGLTVFLGVLVGVVVVAQTLYTSTMEHIKEFGTVKAIGGSNFVIYAILGKQAVISAATGFVVGVLPSLALRHEIAKSGLELVVPAPLMALVFVGTVVFCLAAAMLSFRKVATIDPALVFRS
jgi:putative ABC transport system permease protein